MRAILFDLDGTLLPMDMDEFTNGYFKLLAKKAAPRGYEPKALVAGIWKGTEAMVKNDGRASNETCFWQAFAQVFGDKAYEDIPLFNDFYDNEFRTASVFTSPDPEKAQEAVAKARSQAEKVILATNPIFPEAAVAHRLDWLGLKLADFDYVTTYENSAYCKPNPAYYTEILAKNGLSPDECVMIGNDVQEDILASAKAGIASYLVLDCALNKDNAPYSAPSGTFAQMLAFLDGGCR